MLAKARDARNPLELDLPERRVVIDETGKIVSIAIRERLDAHRLIEDYVIAANVAAAKALEARKAPVMYRIHEPPSREKLTALKDYLDTFDIGLALGQVITTKTFNRIIEQIGGFACAPADHGTDTAQPDPGLLRPAQCRPFRPGARFLCAFHLADPPLCGLAGAPLAGRILQPRAARAPKALSGDKAIPKETRLSGEDMNDLAPIGELISRFERRAMEAERETIDRYVAAFLAERAGRLSLAGSPACRASASSRQWWSWVATGLSPSRPWARNISPMTKSTRHSKASNRASVMRWATRSTCGSSRRTRSPGALRFEIPVGASHMAMPREIAGARKGSSADWKRAPRPAFEHPPLVEQARTGEKTLAWIWTRIHQAESSLRATTSRGTPGMF